MKTRSLPGVNIQFPISQLILTGEKKIETRTYALPKHYIAVPMFLIETPGDEGEFTARATAIIEFGESFKYSSERDFWKDKKNHCVEKSSKWRWSEKPKWGWPIKSIKPLKNPVTLNCQRGIRFTKLIELTY